MSCNRAMVKVENYVQSFLICIKDETKIIPILKLIFPRYSNMQISKVVGIKYILFTDISRGCFAIFHAVNFWRYCSHLDTRQRQHDIVFNMHLDGD